MNNRDDFLIKQHPSSNSTSDPFSKQPLFGDMAKSNMMMMNKKKYKYDCNLEVASIELVCFATCI
jgi:hypothetical protein